ncbi:hypothetical protein C0993_006973 [Termitomyces sp. T159_Od127]|nr:hypothetical protein C0993_006973 [Termitomyces sp. T159_Od127]
MTETPTETTQVMANGEITNPTIDKDSSHWNVRREPIPDIHLVYFQNRYIGYASYNPPKGFSAEELVEFEGAKECHFDLEQARAIIERRDMLGTLDVTGDARWAGLEDKMDLSHWTVRRDAIPDIHVVYFYNQNIGYASYNPPKGFSAEELVEFKGAKECRFDLEQARAVIEERDRLGTLDVTGDARWAGLEDKMV